MGHLLAWRRSSSRWLPRSSVKELCAQLDAAQKLTGSAVLTTCTVLPQKMAAKKQCDGTMCPAGCCPEQNWFCCPDNMYCAATAADCPFVSMKEKLVKMAAKKQCDGTMCPAGCCPEQNWYCCPDNM